MGGARRIARAACAALVALCAVVVLSLATVGCKPGGDDTLLSVALSGAPETLDPHATTGTLTFQVARSIYDTLIEPNADGDLVAALAEQWEFTDGARRLHLTLRQGVRFHNGDPFTAADVLRTLQRLQQPQSPRAADYANIADIEIIDDYQLALHLTEPQSSLLATLASGWSAILPRGLIDSGHDFATMPVGSGPFSFSEWRMGSKIALTKNDDYWKDSATNIARIEFNIIIENVVRVQGLLQGSIDVVDIVDPVDIPRLSASEQIAVDRSLSSLAMVVALNTASPPLTDVRIRRAISHAIDKQRVLDQAYGGGVPITTFMDYSDPYYPNIPERYGYDPAQAQRLLSEAGAAPLSSPLVITVPQNFEPHVRAAELYQQMLADVGLDSELELVDWPTWISRVYTGSDYQLTVIGHTGHLDPAPRFGEYGYTGFADRRLDPLLVAAGGEETEQERRALYGLALDIFADQLPFVFVGTNYRYIITRSDVRGLVVDTKLDTFDFRDAVKM